MPLRSGLIEQVQQQQRAVSHNGIDSQRHHLQHLLTAIDSPDLHRQARIVDIGDKVFGHYHKAIGHLLDLVRLDGSSLEDAIARTPGLGLPFEQRNAFMRHAMQRFAASGDAVPIREFAAAFRSEQGPA